MQAKKEARSPVQSEEQAKMQNESISDSITLPASLQGKLALKPREAAPLIGVGVNRIYELCKADGFPAIKVGSGYIIPVESLQRWLCLQAENLMG